jgi:hypothetical protein
MSNLPATTDEKAAKALAALETLTGWARQHFGEDVIEAIDGLATTVHRDIKTMSALIDHLTQRAVEATTYAHELENQRDFISDRLMVAETAARAALLKEIANDASRTLGIPISRANQLLIAMRGGYDHILSEYPIEQLAEVSQEISDALRLDELPLSEPVPGLPDDFDPEEDY